MSFMPDKFLDLFKERSWLGMVLASILAFVFAQTFDDNDWLSGLAYTIFLLAAIFAAMLIGDEILGAWKEYFLKRSKQEEEEREAQEENAKEEARWDYEREIIRNLPSTEKDVLLVAMAQQVPYVYLDRDRHEDAHENLKQLGIVYRMGGEVCYGEVTSPFKPPYIKNSITDDFRFVLQKEGNVLLFEGNSKPTIDLQEYLRE